MSASLALCLIAWLLLLLLHPGGSSSFILTSNLLLSLLFAALYIRLSRIYSLRQIVLLIAIVACALLFSILTEAVLTTSRSPFLTAIRYPILTPFPILLISILISPRAALLAAPLLSLLLSTHFMPDRFFLLNFACALVTALFSLNIRTRKEIFTICIKSWLVALIVIYSFTLSDQELWNTQMTLESISSFAFFLATALVTIGLLPLFESLFSVLTDAALMEYMNPKHELLKRFAQKMPGTYQHSLALSHLAETAAEAIGANALFCRTATLYHDVGKINHPTFYTENQQIGMNVHQLLTPQESAQVIISHVRDGERIARKWRLPESFIDIIREHHGTTLVYYFYRQELDHNQGNPQAIDERLFRYPGPRPRSKESGIIMICDSVEATSHSMEELTEETISQMVEEIVKEKAADGQFDECTLTLEDLRLIKQALVKSLLLAHHTRIKYPKRPSTSLGHCP